MTIDNFFDCIQFYKSDIGCCYSLYFKKGDTLFVAKELLIASGVKKVGVCPERHM